MASFSLNNRATPVRPVRGTAIGLQSLPTHSTLTLALLTALALPILPALAQTVPDAGQTQREIQRPSLPVAPPAVNPLQVAPPAAAPAADSSVRIAVRSLVISGNQAFDGATLQALIADLGGGQRSLAELEQGAARITAYYRSHGYLLARAYLPAQEIIDGVVKIQVLEGHIGQQQMQNRSRVSDERVQAYLGDLQSGAPIVAGPVDRDLLLLNDLPGVGGVRANLQPGASVGSSDLVVQLDPGVPYGGRAELDNYGNRYTGELRTGGSVWLNSPLQLGDLASARILTSGSGMSYARLAYQVPLGGDGLSVGAAYAYTHYRIGKEFEVLDARGSARSASVYLVYPLLRSQLSNLAVSAALENKDFTDQTLNISTDKQVQVLNLGLAGSWRDGLGNGGITALDATLANGRLSRDATATDPARRDSFSRLYASLYRLQNLGSGSGWSTSALLSGQITNENLNSSEKFALGGAAGVRAYPQGEGIGDQGWMVNLELRRAITRNLQASVFYDEGAVTFNHNPGPQATGDNTRRLAGAGLGLEGRFLQLQLKAALAWRTSGGVPLSEPAGANRDPRFWVQASLPF
jgi:hemolysin activation/secretion protein